MLIPAGNGYTTRRGTRDATPVSIAFQRVLCAVDFSDFSRRALHHADAIAMRDGAELHVLHVCAENLLSSGGEVAEATDQLATFVTDALGLHATRSVVRPGRAGQGVLDYAAEVGSDLIVLGTHGRTGFDRVLVGSTAEHVLHQAVCPVLTIPSHRPAERPDHSRRP